MHKAFTLSKSRTLSLALDQNATGHLALSFVYDALGRSRLGVIGRNADGNLLIGYAGPRFSRCYIVHLRARPIRLERAR